MLNLLFLLVLSPYTAIYVGIYAAYKVYKERQRYIYENSRLMNPWNMGLLLLTIWSFIVGIVNRSIISSFASFAFLLYFSISVLFEMDITTEETIDKIFKYLLKFSVGAAVFGFIEVYMLSHFDMTLWKLYTGLPLHEAFDVRMNSTFVNSNVAADWFAIMTLVSYYYMCRTQAKKEKIGYMLMSCLFVASLIMAGSRGAFAGLIAGLVTLFVTQGNRKNIAALVAIVIIVGIIGFMPNEVSAISNEITGHGIARSFDTREDIWRGAIKMFSEKPVTGWGLTGTIENGKKFFTTTKVVNHAHNIWLAMASSLGIVGLGIYLYMRANVYKALFSLYKTRSRILPLLAGIQMLLIAHGMIDFTIITPQIGILFMGTSSAAIALAKEDIRLRTGRTVIQSNYTA